MEYKNTMEMDPPSWVLNDGLHLSDFNDWIRRADHSTSELVSFILTKWNVTHHVSAALGQKMLTCVQKR